MTESKTETGGTTWDRPVLVMRMDGSMMWSTLSTVCDAASLCDVPVVCHKSEVVGDYVTVGHVN